MRKIFTRRLNSKSINNFRSQQAAKCFIQACSTLFFMCAIIPGMFAQTTNYGYSGGITTYTVPGGCYNIRIACWGAQGGNSTSGGAGGYGAYMSGNFAVTPGQVLRVLVGGQGGSGYSGGGGGGTFVTTSSNGALCIAGGGGGGYYSSYSCGSNNSYVYGSGASIQTWGQYGIYGYGCQYCANSSYPGYAGPGGGSYETCFTGCGNGAGGGGFTGNGATPPTCYSGYPTATGGTSFTNGGYGGSGAGSGGNGGFGGGGGGDWEYETGGGGGGGYGGGGGGVLYGCGGGGGSYNGGSSQVNYAAYNTGNGYCSITPTACYNNLLGSSVYFGTVTPSCSNQTLAMASTSYTQWVATANVQYTLSIAGGSWSGYDMTVFYDNGSAWAPLANSTSGSLTVTPSSANLTYSGYLLLGVYNGTGCQPAWIANSTVLTYSISPATVPAITQSPASGGHICTGGNVTYTASGISVGSFSQFYYGWNTSPNTAWANSNPYTWGSCCPGNTLEVLAQSSNGGCTANSSVVSVIVDYASSTGSFVTSPIYSCVNGTLYNGSGSLLSGESITGYTGTINGWGWGSNTSTCSANTGGYPYSAGSANMNLNCCWPGVGSGSTDVIMVEVTNGACPAAQSCISVTENAMVAPSSASISPAGPVCAPSSGNITLSYSGGFSGNIPGGILKWYSGSCGGTYLGSGQNLAVAAPAATTTYYCAWCDPCGNLTSCASATFTVYPQPTLTIGTSPICAGGGTNTTSALSSSTGGTWASNNTGVATVSGSTATGVAAGSTTFNFTTTTGSCTYTTSSSLTVSAIPTVSINSPTTFCPGSTTTLSPSSGGTWASNNTSAATVSGNTVTGQTAGGNATFTFTSSSGAGCSNTTSSSVVVTPTPTAYGVTGGGTYCLGSSAAVGLSGSQTGISYQLVLNGSTHVGSPVAGTGSAISFGGQTTVGTYTVIATTNANGCTNNMTGSVSVSVLSPNVTNSPGGTGISPNGATLNGTD